jgi:hypothetical protein
MKRNTTSYPTFLTVSFVFGCSLLISLRGGLPQAPSSVAEREVKEAATVLSEAVLGRAVEGQWNDLKLEAECSLGQGLLSLEVFGSGVSIWDNQKQFQMSRRQLQDLLDPFKRLNFIGMEDRYGGKEDPLKPDSKAVIRVTCRVALTIDGHSKQVVQLEGGRQSKELRELAQQVFLFCEKPSRGGLSAADVEDGLAKVGQGKLAPETFYLVIHRKPAPASSAAERGWLLRIHGRKASTRIFVPGQGYQEPVELLLSEPELRELVVQVGRQEVNTLPVNLFADMYTDFSLKVLNREKKIQARQFAGMTSLTHGERQLKFDQVYKLLYQLHSRIVNRD